MTTAKKENILAKVTIWVVALLCLLVVFTKGWLIFFLLPASIIILPLYVIIELVALKQKTGPYSKWIARTASLLTLCLFVGYMSFPGVYDTPGAVLLGFIVTDSEALTYGLYALGIAAFISALILFFTLLGFLIANHHKKSIKH